MRQLLRQPGYLPSLIRRALASVVAIVCVMWASSVAAQERVVVRALGMLAPGFGEVETTFLPGAAVDVPVRDTLQLFAEYAHEVGHSYPPRTPVYDGPLDEPIVIVIVSSPYGGGRRRTDRLWNAGVRLIVPPDRPVRAFFELGVGSIRTRVQMDSIIGEPRTFHSSDTETHALFGGGFSTALSDRTLLIAGYRMLLLSPGSAESWRQLVHVGVGVRF